MTFTIGHGPRQLILRRARGNSELVFSWLPLDAIGSDFDSGIERVQGGIQSLGGLPLERIFCQNIESC